MFLLKEKSQNYDTEADLQDYRKQFTSLKLKKNICLKSMSQMILYSVIVRVQTWILFSVFFFLIIYKWLIILRLFSSL